jgi:CubicO group peptidase (beta-lactamase class C family)
MRIIRWIACVSVLSAWLMWHHSSTTAQTADLHDLDAFIARALQEYQVPGAAIAVVQDGKVVMAQGYGVRDMTKPGVVDEHTIFQLASVTKSLTGAAAASVVDEGKLNWDTPIFNFDGDALKVECGPARYPATLKHWNNGAFVMQFPGATQAPTLTTFTIGVDGKAESFTHDDMGVFTRVKAKE